MTSSLAIHEVSHKERKTVIMEPARVTAPGGRMIILELMGYAVGYEDTLRGVCDWGDVEVSTGSAEVVIGFWPCQILVARKLNLIPRGTVHPASSYARRKSDQKPPQESQYLRQNHAESSARP